MRCNPKSVLERSHESASGYRMRFCPFGEQPTVGDGADNTVVRVDEEHSA